MTVRKTFLLRTHRHRMLMIGTSMATLASVIAAGPAPAQSLRSVVNARAGAPATSSSSSSATPLRSTTMTEALSRQRTTQSRTEQIRSYVLSARDAAVAANRADVTDGLSAHGLDPTATIGQAVAAANAGNTARANELLISAAAATDATGLATWEGAGLPIQTTVDGRTQVTINQTQSRALLSWNSFNIGTNTNLQFNQKSNGVAQPGWVAVNRVTNAVAPSQILGNLTADGTVVVLNQSGIIFGQKSQVNTHSLLASTLELGNAAQIESALAQTLRASTIKERNDAYFDGGLLVAPVGTDGNRGSTALLVSANLAANTQPTGTPSFSTTVEGDVVVDRGAKITSGTGGFLIIAAPKIDSAGTLSATEGQVSLQAGRAVGFVQSTGASTDPDPNIRGFRLSSYTYDGSDIPSTMRAGAPSDGAIRVSGLIESDRGYLSLGTASLGSIELTGLLSTTTSVSRNAKISITAGTVTLAGDANPAHASGIQMLADTNGETIPQGSAAEPAGFKASQLVIGNQAPVATSYIPTNFIMGQNAVIYAPNADVTIGQPAFNNLSYAGTIPGKIDIASGAIIDVSGLKDVQLAASRNQIEITPVKRNELRDTPNYREVALDGNFSLNGATLYVDPRLSGVRADGVAWVGSPLIEAGSLASQIPVTAAEFMTKGGTVTLATNTLDPSSGNFSAAAVPNVRIARDATIDFSGGWVNYTAGTVRTSRLITDDGRIVDIGKADPNDTYIGVAEGFTEIQPRFGIVRTYGSTISSGGLSEASYDEGRDAGALRITAPAVTIDGALYGNSFAGARQIAEGERPSAGSSLPQDGRQVQKSAFELPAGGGVSIASLGDMLIYHGSRGPAESDASELLLNDVMLTNAGLSALSLTANGAITFAGAAPATLQAADALSITGATALRLAPGGALLVEAGRSIRFDGSVEAPSGTITARTVVVNGVGSAGAFVGKDRFGSIFRSGLYGSGAGDDLAGVYAPGTLPDSPFDIIVDGSLSTAGLWVNDYLETGVKRSGAFSDGGSISLTVAPKIFVAIGADYLTATTAGDLSGSIRIRGKLNATAGGYVTPTGALVLTGKGGNVALQNSTIYASQALTVRDRANQLPDDQQINPEQPLDGTNQSVDFTPIPGSGNIGLLVPSLVPDPRSTVEIAPGSIQAFGFGGSGTFSLIAPDVSFGSDNRAGSTHIGLDFFATTGFGTLDVSSYRSRIVPDLFTNARASNSAFLETTQFVVRAGETFDLSQSLLPSILDTATATALRGLGTGADVLAQSYLTPGKPAQLFDQRAANLVLGGLTELDVLAGGTITGAPGASITTSKLYNGGQIVLHGGTISQRNDLPNQLLYAGLGVHDIATGGRGLADAFGGPIDASGRFDEDATNAAGIVDLANPSRLLTNRGLVTTEDVDRLIYFLGKLEIGQGILLDSGSITDLSGIAIFNPRTQAMASGTKIRSGSLLNGGVVQTASATAGRRPQIQPTVTLPTFSSGRTLIRRDDAVLDISGASAIFDQASGMGSFVSYLEWSKGGRISALSGGTLGSTPIAARGGASNAEGGTLEWASPTIGTATGTLALDYLPVGIITASGFDTLAARGLLKLDGDFSLSLGKALLVSTQDATTLNRLGETAITIGATAGSTATVAASYIRFGVAVGANSPIVDGSAPVGDADITFAAGNQGFDFVGLNYFDQSIGTLTLSTPGDVRLTGVLTPLGLAGPALNGQLVANADLTIDARRTYATTGTGNLQRDVEGLSAYSPYILAALGDHTITFGNTYLDPAATAPLSAGSHLQVLAPRIVQNGYLAAPLGFLELGSNVPVGAAGGTTLPTESVTFGAGSVTTVSGAGLNIPYGSTTDLIEYYFSTIGLPLTGLPTGQLSLAAKSIVENAGARIDGKGGGDVFAYEFQSGVGGSRDVLDRFNSDAFSSNGYDAVTGTGYQYPDQRQVFALVPANQAAKIAPYDPSYSADYGSGGPVDLYGAKAGLSVMLDAAPGIAAGEYLLVPAKYALAIPGALRLVENTDTSAPVPGASATLLDGSVIVGGTYSYAGTGISESTRRGFTIQTKDVFSQYSKIATTSGSQSIADAASKNGLTRPRLPIDAARVILAPLNELRVAGVFDTTAGVGGRGGQFDIIGTDIIIAREGTAATEGFLTLGDSTLAGLGATSLLIGGQRSDRLDGTTLLTVGAASIEVLGGARLQAPELLLAVGGAASRLTIDDGAVLSATGALGTQPTGDYAITTAGSLLRLASGAERLVMRTGTGDATLQIGAASITGAALALDSSGNFVVSDNAAIVASQVALSGQSIRFEDGASGAAGVIGSRLEAKLAAADRLSIRSPNTVRFSAGMHNFNDLAIDSATLATIAGTGATDNVIINARNVSLLNSTGAADGCLTAGFCGLGSSLTLNTATLSFGANDVRAAGFADAVTLIATDGMYVEGKGSFSTGNTALTLQTPLLADRAAAVDPRDQKVRPDYSFLTNAAFTLSGPATAAAAPSGNAAPGARIGIGTIDAPVLSANIVNSLIRATAGIVDIQSKTDITLSGATLATPGYNVTFGDSVDAVTVSAGGGTLNLFARNGNIATDVATALVSDSGIGSAGTLNLLASNGTIALNARLNPDATGQRGGSFAYDSGLSAFDLGGFVTRYGTLFGGDLTIRSGVGDLALAAGQAIKARNVSLTADGGAITIGGKIDTSGVDVTGMTADAARNAVVDGGDIALWGAGGVTLAATAVLDTHTTGYADTDTRPASAGDVTIGIERQTAAITIAPGALINVGARRTQAAQAAGESGGRLIPQIITDPSTGNLVTVYRYAEPDSGGIVSLRAPVIGAGDNKVAVSLGGTIDGADSIQLEGFRRYDLDAIAQTGLYSGITRGSDGTLTLNMAQSSANGGKFNPFTENFTLADGMTSVVRFVQDFDVSTVDGSSLTGLRLRPGVELYAKGAIKTETQWNLAAATFSSQQLQAAVAAGDLSVIPEISKNGQTFYSVVPGREGDLLDRFATFQYRVDGTARGEAPVVTLRAGGNLTIDRSISDGFFTFRDESDPTYLGYQLGGGDRTYSPALSFSCGGTNPNCGNIVAYSVGAVQAPPTSRTLTIGLGSAAAQGDLTSGNPFINSPLATKGNGVAGNVDANGVPLGDSLGFGELFPLLPDNNVMHSSDLRLIGGAGALISANPLHVDQSLAVNVTVSGQYTYRVAATGTVGYNGPLQFRLQQQVGDAPVIFDIGDTLDQMTPVGGLDDLADDAYTQINWGTATTGLSADARARANSYFAGKGYRFVGTGATTSGIIAPLSEVIGFLQAFEPTYQAGLASNRTGYTANRTPTLTNFGSGDASNAFVRSYVRSGDGAINVAAARDIDLRGSPTAVYHTGTGTTTAAQSLNPGNESVNFAAAAIYTSGVRVAPVNVDARIIGGGALVSITPDSPYLLPTAEQVDFLPSPKALSDASPVLARGGGDVSLTAGRDVLGRSDVWSEINLGTGRTAGNSTSTYPIDAIGLASQRWRTGIIGVDTEIGIAPRYFSSGVGALGGGDVTIDAGRDVTELTIALDTGATTAPTSAGATLLTFGSGNLAVSAGRDILAGRYDIATGAATIRADRNIAAFGLEPTPDSLTPQYLRVRLTDAVVDVAARGSATLGSVSALGVDPSLAAGTNAAGFFSAGASFNVVATEQASVLSTLALRYVPTDPRTRDYGQATAVPLDPNAQAGTAIVLPPSLGVTSLTAGIDVPKGLLYPSAIGQLRLFSDADIGQLSIAMSDADPSRIGGAFVDLLAIDAGKSYLFPYVIPGTTDAQLRLQHNRLTTHAGDAEPVRIYSNGDINNVALFLPKQARITAGGDIIDMFFNGQNVAASDVTRIRAGGDIKGTIVPGALNVPGVVSNDFILGGPGSLIVEAGGDLGPFVTSATTNGISSGGGIRTIGNEYNPWFATEGADLSARFGMAGGADYAGLLDTYLDPATAANLDGDLFVQKVDSFGNATPDRTKPIYASILAQWLRDKAPDLFASLFPGQSFPDTDAGNAALATAAYGRSGDLYKAFAGIDPLRQQDFLINRLYFNELAQPALPDGPSYLQYVRGYRAVQTLFPTRLGYTDNLAPYTLDPSTISVDHPLGEPVRNIVNGQPQRADRVLTGNVDLRLATFQTARGGDVTILGPGGDVIAGSVVRTSEQPARRTTAFLLPSPSALPRLETGDLSRGLGVAFDSVPIGFEGVLTLRGGQVRSFTDGDFILNQSRVFTQAGGDITMWSSNGDLNAGQGPKSASNFPPVTLRFDLNGLSELNSAGSVSGAGIGAFKRFPTDPAANIILIAPVGEVDAGDAGVRASGNIFVAAARVANADNFSAAGDITGVPSSAVAATTITPANAASAITAQLAEVAKANNDQGNRKSLITVDVLGPAGETKNCDDQTRKDDPDCPRDATPN